MNADIEYPLRARTRAALWDIPVIPDGRVHLKHSDSHRFGSFSALDLARNAYVLHLKDEDGEIHFDSIDAVVDAGWLID